jgi:hypothetical protein
VLTVPEPVRDLALRLAREPLSPDSGLPAYIYDLGSLDAHAARIRAALPREVEFYYAVKANPDPAVLRTVARHADGLEVSSSGELGQVAGEAGGKRRAFGGPGKSVTELAAAVRAGATLHVESPHELRLLASVLRDQGSGATADVLLRANLDVPVPARAGLVMGGSGWIPPGWPNARGSCPTRAAGRGARGRGACGRGACDCGGCTRTWPAACPRTRRCARRPWCCGSPGSGAPGRRCGIRSSRSAAG